MTLTRCILLFAVVTTAYSPAAAIACTDFEHCAYNELVGGAGGSSPGITSRPNPAGGYDYSNGVTSRANPSGGFDYSNGVTCRRNPLGGMDCQ